MDAELYAFQPDDVEAGFFIDANFVRDAALILITAFVTGFRDELKGHVKELGKRVGDWLGKKLGGLFRREAAETDERTIDAAAEEAREMARNADPEVLERAKTAATEAIKEGMERHGVDPSRANEIAQQVRGRAESLVTG